MKNLYLTTLLSILTFTTFAQAPSNDDCTGAIDLGTLPTPNGCDGPGGDGVGATATYTGLTNVNATAPNPYTYVPDCQGTNGNDQANPANDVWYAVTATGNAITIDITGGTLTNPSIAIWSGDCSGLAARGCANSGDLPATFDQIFPGDTYYIQVSGDNSPSEGTFDLAISNSNDCAQCNVTTSLTVDPQPVNGTYTAGTSVTFCYTINEYDQVNTNWMHGLSIENLGAGWDGTITGVSTPTACDDGYGEWVYYDGSTQPCNGGSAVTLPGWYFNVFGSQATPCDNFGDPGLAQSGDNNGCTLTFCFTLTTDPIGSCVPGASLSVDLNTWADGETGNWQNVACENDPNYEFIAQLACCEAPTTSGIAPETCFGTGNGTATITAGSTASPFTYQWYGPGGGIDITTSPGGSSDTQTTLTTGIYTVIVTDANGCQASQQVEITASSAPTVAIPGNQTVCANSDLTISDFIVDPATGTFNWTSDVDVGFGTSGTTQIGTFTADNSTSSVVTANISVTPNASGCPGPPETFTVVVNPAPIISAPGSSICDPTVGQTFTIPTTFTPAPTPVDLSFSDTGTTAISTQQGSNGGTGTGSTSATTSGILPTTLETGQLTSVCFTIRAECYDDISALSITVGGVTYTNGNNADLASILTDIGNATDGNSAEFCLPQTFLTMIEDLNVDANTTWDLTVTDGTANSCGGGRAVADINDFTVVVEHQPVYTYSWSGDCVITSGSTSGTTDVASIPDISAEYVLDGSCTLDVTVTDDSGCANTYTTTLTDNCPLPSDNLTLSGTKRGKLNVLNWYVLETNIFDYFEVERKSNDENWERITNLSNVNSQTYIYNDKSYKQGNNYYRIKAFYTDGSFDYTDAIVIKNQSKAKIIKGIYNVLGHEVELDTKGLIIIFYEDGTSEKRFND